MAAKATRNKAADAARRLLEDRVTLVADLADAGTGIDRAEAAEQAAQATLADARREYRERYRAAVEGGWSNAQLDDVDCPEHRGHDGPPPRPRSRRRSTERAATPAPDPAGQQNGVPTVTADSAETESAQAPAPTA